MNSQVFRRHTMQGKSKSHLVFCLFRVSERIDEDKGERTGLLHSVQARLLRPGLALVNIVRTVSMGGYSWRGGSRRIVTRLYKRLEPEEYTTDQLMEDGRKASHMPSSAQRRHPRMYQI